MLVDWYATVEHMLEIAKLWLFSNQISDAGAADCAKLLHPGLLEVHLSHNFISAGGAKALLAAVPVVQPCAPRPLWLRLEWNLIDVQELQTYMQVGWPLVQLHIILSPCAQCQQRYMS